MPSTIYLRKFSSRQWCLPGLGLQNLDILYKRADFSVIVNISVKTLWCHITDNISAFLIFSFFFQIIMVSFYFAWHDQYFIMFKDSNVFEFTNFLFKTKYNNSVVYSVKRNYLFWREEQEKNLLKQFLDWIYCAFINIPPKLDVFKGCPNSLKESYFTREFRLVES